MSAYLLIEGAGMWAYQFNLEEGQTVQVGRLPKCEVKLNDFSVSARHALIIPSGGQWIVRDNQSSNGTFVNGTPITEKVLRHGDVIRIGKTELAYYTRDQDTAEDFLDRTQMLFSQQAQAIRGSMQQGGGPEGNSFPPGYENPAAIPPTMSPSMAPSVPPAPPPYHPPPPAPPTQPASYPRESYGVPDAGSGHPSAPPPYPRESSGIPDTPPAGPPSSAPYPRESYGIPDMGSGRPSAPPPYPRESSGIPGTSSGRSASPAPYPRESHGIPDMGPGRPSAPPPYPRESSGLPNTGLPALPDLKPETPTDDFDFDPDRYSTGGFSAPQVDNREREDMLWVAEKTADILGTLATVQGSGRRAIYGRALQLLRDAVGADNGFLMVADRKQKRWVIRAWIGDVEEWSGFEKKHPVSLTAANQAFKEDRVISNALDSDDDSKSQSMLIMHVHCYIAVPLHRADVKEGVLYFDTRRSLKVFGNREIRLLQRIGGYLLQMEPATGPE